MNMKKIILPMITGLLLSSSVVMAANSSPISNVDRSFDFYFSGYNSSDCTGHQPKENDSSVYMNYVSCSPENLTFDAHVVGYTNYYVEKDCSFDKNSPSRFSYKYRFNRGNRRFMYNYVLENGYHNAGIRAVAYGKGTATGVWSPDSIPEAGVLPESDYIK